MSISDTVFEWLRLLKGVEYPSIQVQLWMSPTRPLLVWPLFCDPMCFWIVVILQSLSLNTNNQKLNPPWGVYTYLNTTVPYVPFAVILARQYM